MKLSDKIAIAGVIVAFIGVIVSIKKDETTTNFVPENNITFQSTEGSQSPIINTEKDVNINY